MVNEQLERYLPFLDTKVYGVEIHYEHLHRYHFASRFVKDKEVLDLGCGEGYGSNILSKSAKYVLGIDNNEKTIKHARRIYRKSNLQFIQGSATNILNLNRKFDVIICFETIEHLEDHNRLISEIEKSLKSTGMLIISTPDKNYLSKNLPDYKNIFHKKELSFDEFENLLRSKFKHIVFFGQRVYVGSQIWPFAETTSNICDEYIVKKKRNEFSLVSSNEKEPIYIIAVVSKRRLDASHLLFGSYLTDTSNTYLERIRFLEKQIAVLNSIITKVESHFAYRIYMKIRNFMRIK